MVRRAVNGPLPDYDLTGFAEVTSFKLADGLHPVCYLWIGRHLHEKRWAPTPLLRWMLDIGVLTELTVSEIIFSWDKQTEVWLPTPDKFPRYDVEFLRDVVTSECKRIGRIIIGKFTQGESCADDGNRRRKTAKLVLDPGELKFVIDDAVSKGVFYRQAAAQLSSGEPFGTIVEYFNDEIPQYVHLRSFMQAYVSINLLNMVNRFPTIAVRVATDSFYYDKQYHDEVQRYLGDGTTWGTWRVKHEELHRYREHTDVDDRAEYHSGGITKISTSPSIHDPVARHRIVYLNGPGGCGKTTRVIELFRGSNLIALTPTHRLARDFKSKGVAASTYHSFFRWSGDAWTPDRMGTKIIPDVLLWDEACTVPKKIIKMFLEYLNTKNTTVVLCGDHGQPPPFTGLSPHCWLKLHVDYYEEMTIDRRSLDDELTALKTAIRCTGNQNQAEQLREVIPATPLDEFYSTWKPSDIVVASRKATRDIIVRKLFYLHEEKFLNEPVPLCYRPKDTRRQNVLVDIPGRAEQQELVLNDIVDVDIAVLPDAINATDSPWRLGYATTIHSSQGLTITDTIMYIVDDFIEWDNLVYLAVSRVRRRSQLRRVAVTLLQLQSS